MQFVKETGSVLGESLISKQAYIPSSAFLLYLGSIISFYMTVFQYVNLALRKKAACYICKTLHQTTKFLTSPN